MLKSTALRVGVQTLYNSYIYYIYIYIVGISYLQKIDQTMMVERIGQMFLCYC